MFSLWLLQMIELSTNPKHEVYLDEGAITFEATLQGTFVRYLPSHNGGVPGKDDEVLYNQ